MSQSLTSASNLTAGSKTYKYFSMANLNVDKLPYSLKILLENMLRTRDDQNVTQAHVDALVNWDPKAEPDTEIQFSPARVIMQDFTGVPCIVDLATMREAVEELGGDPQKINPLAPAEMVIDHSVVIDVSGSPDAAERNVEFEYQRNGERYQFLRWGQTAFDNFRVVPPGTGIVHQVNIEYLARTIMAKEVDGELLAYPDSCVGTDSHTTMVNGLGVLGWGVGGIEAEAAMLGQPVSMLIPKVVGFKLTGEIPTGATATDVVLTITEQLRKHGVVGKFVEFYGDGVSRVPLANRATIGNMSPEFGSTVAIFPIDEITLDYLRVTGRSQEQIDLVEAYCKAQGLWHDASIEPNYSEYLELDLSTVVPSIAGPKRPQDRVELSASKATFEQDLKNYAPSLSAPVPVKGKDYQIDHGAVTIASITSCTNTSNPSVMLAAGLLARNAVEKGLHSKPWVKTSLAPGSKVVTEYYKKAGLTESLNDLGFDLVGYGCTTCIGNSGPLAEEISAAVNEGDLAVTAVLSGNRNFEGRINPDVKMNYLASPPLVIAYALAGTMDFDFETEPLGRDQQGQDVFLRDIWPTPAEVQSTIDSSINSEMFTSQYASVFDGDERWKSLPTPKGALFEWDDASTYVKKPPYFEGMTMTPDPVKDVHGARVLVKLGDSVTTDHISPAGAIKADSPAGAYLSAKGVSRVDFNSYGSRRGNHEIMIRGTFANIRLRNQLLTDVEGSYTRNFTTSAGEQSFIFDASEAYQAEGTPLVALAGKEYGSGSSRDWAAKGTSLLGIRVVIAESFERIHRSNLIGMGVLPLQYPAGVTAESLGLDGTEVFDVTGIEALNDGAIPSTVRVVATASAHSAADKSPIEFDAVVRIDTPGEADYYRNGGILQYVLRSLVA
ncbi:MAG: aconitate hydratase AcnA [Micrococcales bacterium]|jgi:aconitate hydratase|nr:aconitate hydratase AcnA [Micrococcales bacterium]MBT5398737.1 aconitate hydratase AcnA [Micrococcales bacterium]MBT5431069.1 aconitate hydratase AcnA [Micrococcales bacterium]MBT5848521.1 aconitate hydratase AcnA [Micrococcales bacterium]